MADLTLRKPVPRRFVINTRGLQGPPGEAASGAIDHGNLLGLADDDHPQYLNVARGDARYFTESEVTAALAGKADTSHTHSIANVTGLQSALDGKAAASHTHAQSDITNLVSDLAAKADAASTTAALAGKADASHTHSIANVTGLQSALDGKAAASHTHAQSDITNLVSDLAAKRSKVDEGEFSLPTPTVSTIVLRSKSRLARTINGLYAVQTSAGTVTFTVKINGTAVTGLTSITATTTPQDVTASGSNTVSINDAVTLEITAVSGASGFRFTGQETLT